MKKEKHNLKKYSSLLLLALILVGSACGCSKLESQKQTETELAAGQRKAKLQVVSITGNELTYIEETEAEKDSETETENTGSFGGQMPQMDQQNGGRMPQMDQQNGSQMPQMDQADGKQMSAVSTDSSEEDSSSGRSMPDFFASAAETVTVYLPVSVKVHIGSGKTADFSILEAGDQLEVLFEENEKGEAIITEIWLISMN